MGGREIFGLYVETSHEWREAGGAGLCHFGFSPTTCDFEKGLLSNNNNSTHYKKKDTLENAFLRRRSFPLFLLSK